MKRAKAPPKRLLHETARREKETPMLSFRFFGFHLFTFTPSASALPKLTRFPSEDSFPGNTSKPLETNSKVVSCTTKLPEAVRIQFVCWQTIRQMRRDSISQHRPKIPRIQGLNNQASKNPSAGEGDAHKATPVPRAPPAHVHTASTRVAEADKTSIGGLVGSPVIEDSAIK